MTAGATDAGRQIQEASRRESDEAVETMKKKWGLTVHALTPELESGRWQLVESQGTTIRKP